MRAHSTTTAPRQDNRRQQLLGTAARLFRQHGYHATSMRDIASAVGMLPGSIYYHFASKDELLVTVYREGVSRIAERLDAAVAGKKEPWQQLEAACIAHLQTVLDHSDYAQVVIRVLPDDAPAVRVRLAALRDQYEERFKDLVAALDLPAYVDRHYLRLLLLGALNWSQVWYRRGGDSPRTIAKRFLQVLHGIQAQQR
ncbi:MAG: TetR/AcrR family transcriptional regulator [Acidiferrobacterales bacterium]|jgi:AcrR family transcriptional regulator